MKIFKLICAGIALAIMLASTATASHKCVDPNAHEIAIDCHLVQR